MKERKKERKKRGKKKNEKKRKKREVRKEEKQMTGAHEHLLTELSAQNNFYFRASFKQGHKIPTIVIPKRWNL